MKKKKFNLKKFESARKKTFGLNKKVKVGKPMKKGSMMAQAKAEDMGKR